MTKASTEPPRTGRRTELDVIRALVVLGLVFFHASLVFDARDDFYVKNAETTGVTTIIAGLAVVWAMPVLFTVSGLGAWHSVRRRGPGGFAVERLLRLGVPLVFAVVTILPVPAYLRLRTDPAYHLSYLEFLPSFFRVRLDLGDFPFVLDGEVFEVGHLWFVVMLLAFSLLLAAAVRWVPGGARAREWLAAGASWRGGVLLAAVPVALVDAAFGLEENFAAWSRWAYLLFFLYGFALAADDRLRDAMRRDAVLAAVLAVALSLTGLVGLLVAGGKAFTDLTPLAAGARAVYGVGGWCCVVAIMGLLDRRPRPAAEGPGGGGGRLWAYLAPAVLPLYVLHQPILVAVAYVVVGWHAPILAGYAVIVAATTVIMLGVYDLLVRRTKITRFLLGMRG